MATTTRAQQTADLLRQSICDGYYTCGERLVEFKIAQELACSQNTVRDALRQLEAEGWVYYRARRGVSVRSFTADESEEVFALWAHLESLAFDWALENHTRVDLLKALRPLVERARDHNADGRWTAARQSLFEFHAVIAERTRRRKTAFMLTQIRNQAYLLDTDYDVHYTTPVEARIARIQAYENLLGIIKFGTLDAAKQELAKRITELGKPLVKWLAMHE